MNKIEEKILSIVAGIKSFPKGAFNIRVNGKAAGRSSTNDIKISPKEDVSGIDINIAAGVKNETVHIPVVLSADDHIETVYNDFYIGDDADITIVAGCGIHNCGSGRSQHDGIHSFHVGKNAKVKYIEKHYGEGDGERVLNPLTKVYIANGGYMEMETVQIGGVDFSKRSTEAYLDDNATIVVNEKIMTTGKQWAETVFLVDLNGENSSANVVSRSVAKDNSEQVFLSKINGNNKCMGHSECDAIIMGNANVKAIPEITANNVEASLIHEAAIGKIAGEQITKLMTLGLTDAEAEAQIVNGFLK